MNKKKVCEWDCAFKYTTIERIPNGWIEFEPFTLFFFAGRTSSLVIHDLTFICVRWYTKCMWGLACVCVWNLFDFKHLKFAYEKKIRKSLTQLSTHLMIIIVKNYIRTQIIYVDNNIEWTYSVTIPINWAMSKFFTYFSTDSFVIANADWVKARSNWIAQNA